ncbi:unnamed protein product [Closterium sp. Yama58-4]|nr:unnamed protein product [Closterium sp. Yama58-4]
MKDVTAPRANDFGSPPSNQFAKPPSPNDFAAVKDFTAGVAAGVALVVTGHPFDTVKVKLQASNVANGTSPASQASLGAPRYRSAWQCTSHILRTEGIPGLYRGATSSFIGVAVESSLLFGSYTQIKTALQSGERSAPTAGTVAVAAGLAGGLISFVLCPTELVKVCCKAVECAVGEGVSGGGEAMGAGGASEWRRVAAEAATAIASGGIAGIVFWSAVLPFDVIKTRIQTADASASPESLRMLSQCKAILRESGIRGFYAGLLPTLTRAFPANAAAVVAWELTSRLLGVSNP